MKREYTKAFVVREVRRNIIEMNGEMEIEKFHDKAVRKELAKTQTYFLTMTCWSLVCDSEQTKSFQSPVMDGNPVEK